MLIGFNNDVEYRGKQFHIQTEDHGKSTAKIESQIFHEGQILDTEIVSYDSVLEEGEDEEKVDAKLQSLLEATHKGLYKRLVNGEYDEMVGLEPLDDNEEVAEKAPEEFVPSQDRVPNAAKQVEKEGEEAFEQFHQNEAQKHVDLDDLKSHLAEKSDQEEDEEEAVIESSPAQPDIDPDLEADEESLSAGGAELDGGNKGGSVEGAGSSNPPPESPAQSSPPPESTSSTPATSGVGGSDPPPVEPRSTESGKPLGELPASGVESWNGCEEPTGDLSIVALVESFLDE